jgi:mevalonate kinase
MAVAIARALLSHAKRGADVKTILAAASASEKVMHGKASGIDATVATYGGIGVYRKTAGFRPIAAKLRILVAPSGLPRSTAAMVDRVAQATISGRVASPTAATTNDDARLVELGALTDAGTVALLRGDLASVGAAMNRAHDVLSSLGVSTQELDSLCEAARATGAHGAKLTGAGGGGAVIAVAPRDREAAILAEWKNAGVSGFVSTLGS